MRWIKIIIFLFYCVIVFCLLCGFFEIENIGMYIMLLPFCGAIIVSVHEMSHMFFFKLFGFKLKEFRIGFLDIQYRDDGKIISIVDASFYSGCCTVYRDKNMKNIEIKISLLAGGISSLIIGSVSGLMVVMNNTTEPWGIFGVAMFCEGIYGFVVTLLNPKGGDRKQLEKIKEG